RSTAIERENVEVVFAQPRVVDGLAHVGRALGDVDLGDAVSTTDGQSLADVDLGKVDLGGDVVDDRSGDVELCAGLDTLEAWRRIDLHDLRAIASLEHVDAGDAQSHDLGGADGGLLVHRVQVDRFGAAPSMEIAAE